LTLVPHALEYLEERQFRRVLMPSSAKGAWYVLANLARCHGDAPIDELGDATVTAFLECYAGSAASSQRRAISAAHTFCQWLVRRRVLRWDPFRDADKPRMPRSIPRALDADAVSRLFDACPTSRERLVVSLMVNEGLRCVEVSRLELADVDIRDRTMRVTGKGMHERLLPITYETYSCLLEYQADMELIAGPLIVNARFGRDGIAAQRVSDLVTELMYKAGIKTGGYDRVTPHALRHTAATDVLRNGAHIRDVQFMLGHASLTNTQVYLPLMVNDLRDAMAGRSYRLPNTATVQQLPTPEAVS
jgi:site-specific recombinase XerD